MSHIKRIIRFLREYRLFSLALVAIVAGLVFELAGMPVVSHWILGVVASLEVLPLAWRMWRDIRVGHYGIDILAATAIVASVILGQYWAAIVVVLMLTGGEALEDFAHHRAKTELTALLKHAPQKAHILRKGKVVPVKVSELKVGDKIIINAGELVPADAVVLDGTANFDESSLTGESLPQAKGAQDQLMSGSLNLDGAITAKATATAANSQYERIIKLVRNATASQAPFTRLADRYSIPFTILAYAIAGSVWAYTGDPIRFLEVIVVATPCPLLLAAPIALISGMARASRYGIIVKTGAALEKLADARTMAFDKTGTLTKGQLEVDSITAYGAYNREKVLSVAASLEQGSNHAVAQAIVAAAQRQKVKFKKSKLVKEVPGRGLQSTVKGQEVVIGRLSFLNENNVKIPAKAKRGNQHESVVYVAVDGSLAGVITLKDELRPEAKATLAQLHDLGIRQTLMITGDNQATAQAIANQLGIDHVHAEALPADKLRILSELKDRPIAFVGDGVNDAPILTASDVGIALGARGSAAASESADMVIMLDDVSRVAAATKISKRTFQIARQSILVGIGLSSFLMLVFATGKFTALTGAIVQEAVDVIVIFNALRAHMIDV